MKSPRWLQWCLFHDDLYSLMNIVQHMMGHGPYPDVRGSKRQETLKLKISQFLSFAHKAFPAWKLRDQWANTLRAHRHCVWKVSIGCLEQECVPLGIKISAARSKSTLNRREWGRQIACKGP